MIVLPLPVDRWETSHKVSGFATFVDAHTIQVNEQQYQAKAFYYSSRLYSCL